jgi:hypothetical protein
LRLAIESPCQRAGNFVIGDVALVDAAARMASQDEH